MEQLLGALRKAGRREAQASPRSCGTAGGLGGGPVTSAKGVVVKAQGPDWRLGFLVRVWLREKRLGGLQERS